MNKLCVCILAHNEAANIENTINCIASSSAAINFNILVYANGCTDATEDIVKKISIEKKNVFLRHIDTASKPNAWNTAFNENDNEIIIFSDGDVCPEPDAIIRIQQVFEKDNASYALIGCSVVPANKGIGLQQKIVGFMQLPLYEDFLSGAFYAIKRNDFIENFATKGMKGLPLGIVAEDAYIQALVPSHKFKLVDIKIYYKPPLFHDYLKYLARVRWQSEQLLNEFTEPCDLKAKTFKYKLYNKLIKLKLSSRLFVGFIALITRLVVKIIYYQRIIALYKSLGSVDKVGKNILSEYTRSQSVK